jgi:hypothetical protein
MGEVGKVAASTYDILALFFLLYLLIDLWPGKLKEYWDGLG